MGSIGVRLIPFAGSIQSAVEVVTGYDYIAGEPVNRGLAALGLLAGIVPGGKADVKGGAKAVQAGVKHMSKMPLGKMTDQVTTLADSLRKAGPGAKVPNAPRSGYLNPGIGSAARGQIFNHAWIKHDLYNELRGLVGKADFNKFLAALEQEKVSDTLNED